MPELRKDPVSNRWVIISTERSNRPFDFEQQKPQYSLNSCPFCPGQESETPIEIDSIPSSTNDQNQSSWAVRVIPNKFKVLTLDGVINREGIGIFDKMNGIGTHEVIIESPDHDAKLADMPINQLLKILMIYKRRITELYKDDRFRYILIFKNYGEKAGASLAHPHTQIIATPITPITVKAELDNARDYYYDKERCIFCDIIKQEIDLKDRIVIETNHFITISPFAARFPFEVTIFPKKHNCDFSKIPDDSIEPLAYILKETLSRIKTALDDPSYNFVIHTIPNIHSWKRRVNYWETIEVDYHWHIEIIPRLSRIAGFEWGTGFYINPTLPEDAAKSLREAEKTINKS
ncbi:galactose-1-phosphate uridylyltransferase [bacterium]|nr:galactose-1-phosphate uridylyltransferase [bacterium]